MSEIYTNPLDRFASYSTHFILLAARSTDRINAFLSPDRGSASQTLDAIDRVERLGDLIPLSSAGSDAYLVLDTRRFSHFSISDLRFEVFVNGLQNGQAHSSFATTLSMTVLDNAGISFFNYLQWLMDARLQTNFDGMVFLLRVLFIGHTDRGETQLVQSVTIPAMLFNLELDLDAAKGAYTCEFMPLVNFSLSAGERWLNIGTATNFFSGIGNNTLGGIIDKVQERINQESESRFNALQEAIRISRAGQPLQTPTGKFGRLVRYQITIPEEWRKYQFTGRSINSAEEKDHTRTDQQEDKSPTPAKDVHVSTDSGLLITQVLDQIFRQVKEISDYASADQLRGSDRIIRFYKHLVYITSDDSEFIVHIDVIPFEVPDVKPSQSNDQLAVSRHQSEYYVYDEVTQTRRPKNYFTLDYIFTGKNIDVLNFEMKMQSLQFLLAANVKVSQGDIYNVVKEVQVGETENLKRAPDQKEQEVLSSRPYDPMLIPLLTKAQSTGFSQFAKSRSSIVEQETTSSFQSYVKNLSAFYAASPITVNATIRGNPDLFAKFNVGTIMPHEKLITNTGQQEFEQNLRSYRERLTRAILRSNEIALTSGGQFRSTLGTDSYVRSPVFVKVNVRGPNVDFRTNGPFRDPQTLMPIAGQDFSSEVLIDNYYTVMKITNNISGGNFTQDLELWVHNVFGYASPMEKSPAAAAPIKVK